MRAPNTPSDPIAINPKSMAVLLCLAERPGEVLTKPEIFDQVWPDSHVGDDVLANAVWELRRAFQDKARDPSYIQTIHRRGYRLIATVDQEAEDGGNPPTAPLLPPPMIAPLRTSRTTPVLPSRRTRALAGWLSLLLLLGTVAYVSLAPASLTLALQHFETEEAIALALSSQIREGLKQRLEQLPHLRLLQLPLFTRTRIAGSVTRRGESVKVDVSFRGLPERNDERALQFEDKPENIEALIEKIFLELRVILETESNLELENEARIEQAIYFLETGRAFHRQGDFEHAIPYLEGTVQLDDRQLEAFDLLANIYHVYGLDKKALINIEQALELVQDQAGVEPFALARRKAQILEDTEAEHRILLQLRQSYPNDFKWSFKLAWFKSTHFRNCRESLRLFEDATWGAGKEDMFAYRAETLLFCKSPREAIQFLQNWPFEESARYFEQLAEAQQLAGDYDGAQNSLFRARDLGSQVYPLLDGQLAMAQGWYTLATTYLQDFLKQATWPNAQARGLLALAEVELLKTQDLDLAEGYAQRALAHKPQDPLAFWILGRIEVQRALQDADRSAEYLTQAERHLKSLRIACCSGISEHQEEFAHHLLGRIALARGRYTEAVRSFQLAIDLHPRDRAFFLAAKAQAFFQKGDPVRARQVFGEVFRFNPHQPLARCLLGQTLALEGEFEKAEEHLERCLNIYGHQPQDPVGQAAAGQLFQLRTAS